MKTVNEIVKEIRCIPLYSNVDNSFDLAVLKILVERDTEWRAVSERLEFEKTKYFKEKINNINDFCKDIIMGSEFACSVEDEEKEKTKLLKKLHELII